MITTRVRQTCVTTKTLIYRNCKSLQKMLLFNFIVHISVFNGFEPLICQWWLDDEDILQLKPNEIRGGEGLACAYRYSYHGVVGFPFRPLVEAKLGRRLRRLDIADYQNTGLRIWWRRDLGNKMSTLNIDESAKMAHKKLGDDQLFSAGVFSIRVLVRTKHIYWHYGIICYWLSTI